MSRICELTGKGRQVGHNVSHANNKTRRRFLPNLQHATMHSEALGRRVSLRLSTSAMRTIEKHGGLDAFLMQARNAELADEARQLKREIKAAQAADCGADGVLAFPPYYPNAEMDGLVNYYSSIAEASGLGVLI